MDLDEYNSKRKFSETPEPKGQRSPSGNMLRFVVQKHAASKLHYDFRLELDGVLKSWAVPKGPSMNPKDKRLAMPVEDHPLSYRDFEGIIPEGNYGAGEVIVWDRGTYYAPGNKSKSLSEDILREGLNAGKLNFVLEGEKLKGEFSLRKMQFRGKDAWLLVKRKDEFSSDADITELKSSVISNKELSEQKSVSNKRSGTIYNPANISNSIYRNAQLAQEGIIAKNENSQYLEGERSLNWQKIKTHMRQEAIICGFTEPHKTRKYFGALVLGIYDNNMKLKYIGHTGSGFNQESLKVLHERLTRLIQKRSPFDEPPKTNMPVHWVKPEIVCEVSFSQWTEDGQLRQPIFEGLREDKKPEDVVREEFAITGKVKPERRIKSKYESPSGFKQEYSSHENKGSSGKKLLLTNLKKIYWPEENITKGDLVNYYKSISKYILPYLKNRPHTLLRHPNGINEKSFFQKDVKDSTPDWIKTIDIVSESNNKEITYLVCTNRASLLYMVNLGCIEINPWSSRINKLDRPDYMVIDLDPLDVSFDKVIETALVVKEVLDESKAKSYCKTSGATGLHIYVPLKAKYHFEIVKNFANLIVQLVHQKLPEITSLDRSPAKRNGKVYLDYLQNKIGQTLAAPYSVRPMPGATVSTPLEWKEVKPGLDPKDFTIKNILKRINKRGDIFKGVMGAEINIIKCINNLEAEEKLK